MNPGVYNLKDFLTYLNLEQIIVPEIQRDYVWQKENVLKLLNSIKNGRAKNEDSNPEISEQAILQLPPAARAILAREWEDKKHNVNVGFIYAYFDREQEGRFILIDGQQRLTTLFLLILALSVRETLQAQFRRNYFKNGFLKLDYKVREAAHEFLLQFVEYILEEKAISDVKDESWYFVEYEQDNTIARLLENYSAIAEFVSDGGLSLEFVENHVEIWYYDTDKSAQGEELYIYMNSRGEAITANESIKAELLKGLAENDKHEWGEQWESWQNYFWKHRSSNRTADQGFEEFLKWLCIIDRIIAAGTGQATLETIAAEVRSIREAARIPVQYLGLAKISGYMTGLVRLFGAIDTAGLAPEWLAGRTEAIDLVRIVPALMYVTRHQNGTDREIQRYARFFRNIVRSELISKTPYVSLIYAVQLTDKFLSQGGLDICEIAQFAKDTSFQNILTEEELRKLKIIKEAESPEERIEIEDAFWLAEDYLLSNGKIQYLFDFMKIPVFVDPEFKIDNFKAIFEIIKLLFDQPDDLLRRALLTKGDYYVHDGRTWTLDADRYSFIEDRIRWRNELQNSARQAPYISLITDFANRLTQASGSGREGILNEMVAEYLQHADSSGWNYYFIRYPQVLDYCRRKFACYSPARKETYLLQDKRAAQHNWSRIEDFVKALENAEYD
jgi:hypothetical protein